jgi:PhnB protein
MNQTITPYITVNGAAKAIEFYKKAFGAVETAARYTEPNGRVGHAEIEIGGARLMLSDEHPEIEVLSPQTLGGTPAMFHLSVPDAAATVARAAAEGATVQRAVQDQPYGERSGTIKDPFGHRWMIATHVEEVSKSELQKRVGDSYKIT